MRARLFTAVAIVAHLSGCGLFDRGPPPPLADRFPDTLGGEPFDVDTDVGGMFSTETDIIPDLGVELSDVVVVSCPGSWPDDAGQLGCIGRLREQGSVLEDGWRGGRRGFVRDDGVLGDTFIFIRDDALYVLNGNEELMDELVAAIP